MERRTEKRVAANQPVELKLLGETPAGTRRIQASMTNFSGRGMQLYTDEPVALDTAVEVDLRLDGRDAMVLGEVKYCAREGDRFSVGLHLEHSLLDLTSLGRLVHQLLSEDRRAARERVTAGRT
ncbi:MAG: PilZ domain-containing protein [Acidobacteria bacterium]|nr:PilZ domain-containing protein [Acidobacteriota bacterium]